MAASGSLWPRVRIVGLLVLGRSGSRLNCQAKSGLLLGGQVFNGLLDGLFKFFEFQFLVGRQGGIPEIFLKIFVIAAAEDFFSQMVEDKVAGGNEQVAVKLLYFG